MDLSDEHLSLRSTLEKDVKSACCNNGNQQPIMLQGAFGIGKTTTLCYLFHYAWEVLKTPAFYMPLAKIVNNVRDEALKKTSGKVQNHEISGIVSKMIDVQMNLLESDEGQALTNLCFPEFKDGQTLDEYLIGFQPLILNGGNNDGEYKAFENVFSRSVISEAMATGHRALLLVDEFESKFYELKKYVEASGGGILRELFDQIVVDRPFFMVIGNGPASGYEVAKEFGEDANGGDSDTAANRRLKTMQIPFPTVDLLKQKFMDKSPNGFANFIWWMSRCRPGHIQKLCDSIDFEIYKQYSFSDFIARDIFKEPIDNSGEPVRYLKTSYLNEIDPYLFKIMKPLLLEMQPHLIKGTEGNKKALRASYQNFYGEDEGELVKVEGELVPALAKDISAYLKSLQEEGHYGNINYVVNINKYFSYILSACANEENMMAFSMIGDANNKGYVMTDIFLIPLLELAYDFISQYEDDLEASVKETKDFILHLINKLNAAVENKNDDVEDLFEEVSSLFGSCRVKAEKNIYIQLSLKCIREIIEQPIGSPKLNYKEASLARKLETVQTMTLASAQRGDVTIIFIPVLEEAKMTSYLQLLKSKLINLLPELHHSANKIVRVVYLKENEQITALKNDFSQLGISPVTKLQKLKFSHVRNFISNFEAQVTDFVDSLAKIIIVGNAVRELYSNDIEYVTDYIKVEGWTRKKEDRRTIEHYSKMIREGDNALLKVIENTAVNEYESALQSLTCNFDEYEEKVEWNFDEVTECEGGLAGPCEKFLAQLYLYENAQKRDKVADVLLDVLKEVGDNASENKLSYDENKGVLYALKYDQLNRMLGNESVTSKLLQDFNPEAGFVGKMSEFVKMMNQNKQVQTMAEIFSLMDTQLDGHWLVAFNDRMSYGCVAGAALLKLLLLSVQTANFDVATHCQRFKNDIQVVENQLTSIRQRIQENSNTIFDNLYFRGLGSVTRTDNMPFRKYSQHLSRISILIVKTKLLLGEQGQSLAVIAIVASLYQRLVRVVNSAKKVSEQIQSLTQDLLARRDRIRREYQSKIDLIYQDPVVAKLISLDDSQPENMPRYNNDACWDRFVRYLRVDDAAKTLFDADIKPVNEQALTENHILAYYRMVENKSRNLQDWMQKALLVSQNAQQRMQKYYELKEYVEKLLKH